MPVACGETHSERESERGGGAEDEIVHSQPCKEHDELHSRRDLLLLRPPSVGQRREGHDVAEAAENNEDDGNDYKHGPAEEFTEGCERRWAIRVSRTREVPRGV